MALGFLLVFDLVQFTTRWARGSVNYSIEAIPRQ